MKKRVWILGLVVVALGLLIGGVAWAAEVSDPPDRLPGRVVRGTVTAVEPEVALLETEQGEEVSLLITDATWFWVPGQPPTRTVELAVGDPVLAFGQPMPDAAGVGQISARAVVVAGEEELPKVVVRGRVVAVTQQTMVVQTGRRERAVTVLPRTRLWSTWGRLDSLRDVRVGDQVLALGQPTELGQWVAGLVVVLNAERRPGGGLRGQVTALDAEAQTLTVQTEGRGEILVVTDERTRFRIPGVEAPGFDDVRLEDWVVVVGRPDPDDPNRFLARGIGVVRERD
jgi:RNase P/RNase MRP subunit p29